MSYHKNGLVSGHQFVGRWFMIYAWNILTKLYWLSTVYLYLCMDGFVVGTISLVYDLHSLSSSCFRSCGRAYKLHLIRLIIVT